MNKPVNKPMCPECGAELELGIDVAGAWTRKIKKDGNLHKTINRCTGHPNGASYLICPKCKFSYDCEHASQDIPVKELDEWIHEHLEEILEGWA